METIRSFKGYGKVDEAEQQAFRRNTRKRIIILLVSSFVLLAVVIGAVAGTVIHNRNSSNADSNSVPYSDLTPAASIKAVCSVTQYPNSCLSSLEASNSTDPEVLFKLSLRVAAAELSKLAQYPNLLAASTTDPNVTAALKVCDAVFDDAADRLADSISSMEVGDGENLLSDSKINDIKTWLSTSITDQETCLDALRDIDNAATVGDMELRMRNSTEFASNSLAIVAKILSLLTDFKIPIHRKLLGHESSDFPWWVGPGYRRVLQEMSTKPNATVAADGSGDYRTIAEAVAKVGKKSKTRFVIYIKAGTYKENLVLDKNKWNVMMYGDGKTKTIVTGSLNFVDGTATFHTATVAVAGRGFIAKDMRFENTAGAAKHQAVALRSGSDESVFYRCAFDGYQDTLYAHSNRQFYRECDITGTIDFIFGNAAVVFQGCNIMPRQPMSNQFNTITAQGKKDPNQNTGISIHKCTFSAFGTLTAPTYLGRPWKDYSTTVIMQSTIGPFLNAIGWKEWVSGVEPPKTIFYAEYMNAGLGAGVGSRVKWAGYKSSLTAVEAGKFTVGTFIQGTNWLPATTVAFDSTL